MFVIMCFRLTDLVYLQTFSLFSQYICVIIGYLLLVIDMVFVTFNFIFS